MSEKREPGPLRKIVADLIPAEDAFARRKVRLECGHEVWCSSAAIYQARCRHCRTAIPQKTGEQP